MRWIVPLMTLLLCSPALLFSAVIRVPTDQPSIQTGIDAAMDGDTVLVAGGVYTGEGNRDIDFTGKAVNLVSEDGPSLTIIDCGGSAADPHRGFIFQNEEGPGSVISGFTIRGGYETQGGGIRSGLHCSPTISGNVICDNTAESSGGGIFIDSISEAIIRQNTIIRNRTLLPAERSVGGGGIYLRQSTPDIEDNIIIQNRSESNGGGIYIRDTIDSSPLHLQQNLIAENRARLAGGGVYLDHPSEYIYFTGSTIARNSADLFGGGIYVSWGYYRCYLDDTILWGNEAPEGPQGYIRELTVFNYCDVQDGAGGFAGDDQLFWGEGNLNGNPFFFTGPLGDYYLGQTAAGQLVDSPCVDAGTPGAAMPDGTTRTDLVADAAPLDIGFHYPILPGPQLRLGPSSFTFHAELDGDDPSAQQLEIRNGGPGTMNWTVQDDAPWLTLDPLSGSTSSAVDLVHLNVDSTGLPHGDYQATIQISAPGAGGSPQMIPVRLFINTQAAIDAGGGDDFSAIQPALDWAVDGDRLAIAPGVYTGPLNRDLTFNGKSLLLESTEGSEATLIDCQSLSKGIGFTSGEGAGTLVRGLTIINGQAEYGGGIFAGEGSSPTLEDIHISNCVATMDGGGIYCDRDSSPQFTGSLEANSAGGQGGGCAAGPLAEIAITDSIIAGNVAAEKGGGLAALQSGRITVLESEIVRNRANSGGGIAIDQGSSGNDFASGYIRGNSIQANRATTSGGGLYIHSSNVHTIIGDNSIYGNLASNGAGLYLTNYWGSVDCTNNLFSGNRASARGGGVYCGSLTDTIQSGTFVNNEAGEYGGGIYCALDDWAGTSQYLLNCVVHGNDAPGGPDIYINEHWEETILHIEYCDVDPKRVAGPGTLDWGEGNITADPLFASGPLGTFYLSQFAAGQHLQSPCVDAGDPQGDVIDGTTRTDIVPDEGVPDMGFHYPRETVAGDALIVTGPGPASGNPSRVRVFPAEQDAAFVSEFTAYGADRYGVMVVTGELDGDFGSEIITGAGPGDVFGAHVRGFETDGAQLPGLNFLAYSTRHFGVNVASGDITGDGNHEIVTGPGPGAVFGPHVRAFDYDGNGVTPLPGVSYFAYPIPSWGVNVACGDIDGDGFDEIVTGPGPGAVYGPHVRGWSVDGGSAAPLPGVSFLAYKTGSFGVQVACGDVDGDGIDEIITGPGPGAMFGSHVRGWNSDGGSVTDMPGINFFAWPPSQFRYGVRICADADLSGNERADIVTGPGPDPSANTPLRVFRYNGSTITLWLTNEAYPDGWSHGINVASGNF